MADIETRSLTRHTGKVEVRAAGGKKNLVGYAALYDSPSEDLGGFIEIIRKGAFDRALAEDQEVLARREHDSRLLLGRRSSGTLILSSDDIGLRYEVVDATETDEGRNTVAYVERGDIKGSSFAFTIPDPDTDQRWTRTKDGVVLRELLDLDLRDVAPVATPAYAETSVSARALERAKEMQMSTTKPPADVPFDEAALREKALGRAINRMTQTREQSFENLMEAIYAALRAALGSPWMSDASWWYIVATFDDRVIVQRFDGKTRLFQYPMTLSADGVPSFGDPIEVEVEYVPVVPADGTRDTQLPPAEDDDEEELRLRQETLEAELQK